MLIFGERIDSVVRNAHTKLDAKVTEEVGEHTEIPWSSTSWTVCLSSIKSHTIVLRRILLH